MNCRYPVFIRLLTCLAIWVIPTYQANAADTGFLTNGLVAYYPFNANANDESGSGSHGTFQRTGPGTGYEFVTGVVGNAVKMQGITYITGTGIQIANKSHTISFWYRRDFALDPKPPVYGGGFGVGTQGPEVAGKRIIISFGGDDLLRYSFWFDDFDVSNVPFGRQGWDQIVFTFDASTMQRAIYRDGVQVATQAAAYGFSGGSDFVIGGGDASSELQPTAFDEFRVYNRALTSAEVQQLYSFELLGPDTDRDGLTDEEEEFTYNTSPSDPDSDDDGLNDGDEIKTHHTNPLKADSDGDGYTDSTEIFAGKDPRDASSHPAASLSVFTAVELEFFTQTDKQYVIESSADLSSWTQFEGPIPGDGKVWRKTFSARETETRFYRVVLAP